MVTNGHITLNPIKATGGKLEACNTPADDLVPHLDEGMLLNPGVRQRPPTLHAEWVSRTEHDEVNFVHHSLYGRSSVFGALSFARTCWVPWQPVWEELGAGW